MELSTIKEEPHETVHRRRLCGTPVYWQPRSRTPMQSHAAPALMQEIAIENNYSETAFVVKIAPGHYDLKWFTPGGEIDLCGHATLAAAYVICQFTDPGTEEIYFHTLSGVLKAVKQGPLFTLDFPAGKSKPIPVTSAIQQACGGIAQEAYFDGGDLVVVANSQKQIEQFIPNDALIVKLDGLGLILTAPGEHHDFVSRCFYPKLHISEDPVTGRAHTFLAPIWSAKLNKSTLTAKQLSKRTGVLTVRTVQNRVFLSGQVQLFLQGEIPFDL